MPSLPNCSLGSEYVVTPPILLFGVTPFVLGRAATRKKRTVALQTPDTVRLDAFASAVVLQKTTQSRG